MSKIVQAINAMISNPQLISNVIKGSSEIFFLYKGKYKWSMTYRNDDGYFLWYYPGDSSIETLAMEEWHDGVAMVTYRDVEIGTKEAKASFAELYNVVKEKVYGVDAVLDDIINEGF